MAVENVWRQLKVDQKEASILRIREEGLLVKEKLNMSILETQHLVGKTPSAFAAIMGLSKDRNQYQNAFFIWLQQHKEQIEKIIIEADINDEGYTLEQVVETFAARARHENNLRAFLSGWMCYCCLSDDIAAIWNWITEDLNVTRYSINSNNNRNNDY